ARTVAAMVRVGYEVDFAAVGGVLVAILETVSARAGLLAWLCRLTALIRAARRILACQGNAGVAHAGLSVSVIPGSAGADELLAVFLTFRVRAHERSTRTRGERIVLWTVTYVN